MLLALRNCFGWWQQIAIPGRFMASCQQQRRAREVGFVAYRLRYTQVGLVSYHVEEMGDLEQLERDFLEQRRQARELRKAAEFARGEEPKRRKRRLTKKGPQPQLVAKKPRVTPQEGHDAQSDSGESLGSGDSGSAPDSLFADSDYEGLLGDIQQEAEEAELGDDAPAEPQPVLQHNGHRIRVLSPDGSVFWGSISVVKEGTEQEAISVYCARHRCALMKRMHAAPSQAELVDWLAKGWDLPAGAAYQNRHKGMLPR